MASALAPMHSTRQSLFAYLVTGGDWVQAASPLLLQHCLATMARGDLPWHKLALPARPWVANIPAGMIATCQIVAANLTAREHPILVRQLPFQHHLAAQQCLRFLATEAQCRVLNLAFPAGAGVADLLATVPPAGQHLLARLPTRDRGAPVGAATGD